MKYTLISAFLLALSSIAAARPGGSATFTEVGPKSSIKITPIHPSDLAPELRRRETQTSSDTLPNLPDKPQEDQGHSDGVAINTTNNLKRRDPNAHFESSGRTVNAIEAYEAIMGFGAYFGLGKDIYPGDHLVDNNRNKLSDVAATLTVGNTVVYICSYHNGKQHLDTDTWLDQMWPIINSDFQQNSGQPGTLRAAYYSQPHWNAAYGFTNVGTAYCSRKRPADEL